MVKTFEKYDLLNLLVNAVESGIIMPLNVFKRHVTNVVKVYESMNVLKPHALCTQLLACLHNVLTL